MYNSIFSTVEFSNIPYKLKYSSNVPVDVILPYFTFMAKNTTLFIDGTLTFVKPSKSFSFHQDSLMDDLYTKNAILFIYDNIPDHFKHLMVIYGAYRQRVITKDRCNELLKSIINIINANYRYMSNLNGVNMPITWNISDITPIDINRHKLCLKIRDSINFLNMNNMLYLISSKKSLLRYVYFAINAYDYNYTNYNEFVSHMLMIGTYICGDTNLFGNKSLHIGQLIKGIHIDYSYAGVDDMAQTIEFRKILSDLLKLR